MGKIKSIIVWCLSIYSILAGICSNEFTISNILFILAGLCIMPPIVKKVTEKTTKYSKKVKWIVFITLTLFAYGTYPVSNNIEVNNNVSHEQNITENYMINYDNAESLEEDLNNGIDINGKIVKFKVREYVKDSATGYNAHSGEHLNFISETDLNLESDVEVVGKVKSYKDFLGSWIINYEMIEIDSSAKEQAKKEAEEQAKKEAEEQAKKEAEAQAKREAEEQAKKEAEEQAKKEAEEQAKKEAEEQARKQAETQAKREAEEQNKKEAEKQAQKQSSTVTVPASETGSNLVWVPTNGGKKYHSRSGCSNMKNPNQVTKATAEANGFTPCGRCY